MAFKLKGMTFGKGTGYKSPQMMKKESAMKMAKKSAMKKDNLTGKMESTSERATRAQMDKMAMNRTVKKLTPKSRATNRKPQSQMTDAELAEAKGIKKPQSLKPTPPRRKYGDTPNKMAKKSAMKKKDDSSKSKTTPRRLTPDESMFYAAIRSGVIPGTRNIGKYQPFSKYRTIDGKKVKIYDSADIKKNPGESDEDYRNRVHKSNQKEFRKSFFEQYNKKKNKSPNKKVDNTVSTDLIVQGRGESNDSYKKRKSEFVSWVQANAGPSMNSKKAQNYANQSNATFDSGEPGKPKSKEQRQKERERVELAERKQKKSAMAMKKKK